MQYSTLLAAVAMTMSFVTAAVAPARSEHTFPLVGHGGTGRGRMTNAKRFAAGLSPLPPKSGHTCSVSGIQEELTLRLQDFGGPEQVFSSLARVLKLYADTGVPFMTFSSVNFESNGLAYLDLYNVEDGTYFVATTPSTALTLSTPDTPGDTTYVTLSTSTTYNTVQTTQDYPGDNTLVQESAGWLPVDVEQTTSFEFSWVNPDGTSIGCLLYQSSDPAMGIIATADINAVQVTYPGTYRQVYFIL
ncbi:hypothetical protein FRB99_008099 [Tulasnella sp. 403]|nr:hypothetical protein FRB99_008099 [Tulasnella sp. 403]